MTGPLWGRKSVPFRAVSLIKSSGEIRNESPGSTLAWRLGLGLRRLWVAKATHDVPGCCPLHESRNAQHQPSSPLLLRRSTCHGHHGRVPATGGFQARLRPTGWGWAYQGVLAKPQPQVSEFLPQSPSGRDWLFYIEVSRWEMGNLAPGDLGWGSSLPWYVWSQMTVPKLKENCHWYW